MDRAQIVHETFRRRVAEGDLPAGAPPSGSLGKAEVVALYRAQCLSRALDRQARVMQKAGQGYYTIGSSGHEGMAAVAARAPAPTTWPFSTTAMPRSRSRVPARVPGPGCGVGHGAARPSPVRAEDPISGGRHKVLGSKRAR